MNLSEEQRVQHMLADLAQGNDASEELWFNPGDNMIHTGRPHDPDNRIARCKKENLGWAGARR